MALSGPVRVRETRNGVVWCGFSRGVTYRDVKYNLLRSLYGHVSPPVWRPFAGSRIVRRSRAAVSIDIECADRKCSQRGPDVDALAADGSRRRSRPKASARGRGRPRRPGAAERRRQAGHIIVSGHWAVAAAARRPAGPLGPPAPKPARRATALEPRPRGHPASPTCTGAVHGLAVSMRGLGPAQAPGGSAARADGRVSFARASHEPSLATARSSRDGGLRTDNSVQRCAVWWAFGRIRGRGGARRWRRARVECTP